MSIVIYTNSKNGCRYAYESTPITGEDGKTTGQQRTYLGKVDDDGNIIYSSHKRGGARQKTQKTIKAQEARKAAAASAQTVIRENQGGNIMELYKEAEQGRQELLGQVQVLKAENEELKRENKRLRGAMESIHTLSAAL